MKLNWRHIFFPDRFNCIVCDAELAKPVDIGICSRCQKTMVHILGDEQCLKCGTYLPTMAEFCPRCQKNKRRFAACRAPYAYKNGAVAVIKRLKSESGRWLAKYCAEAMRKKIASESDYSEHKYDLTADLILPVPLHKSRLKERGHNQAASLAKCLAPLLGLPFEPDILTKPVETAKQAMAASAKERAKNLENAFAVITPEAVKGKRVLVVDDVITTGATLNEIARTLRRSSAKRIVGITFAATVTPLLQNEI